jgi:hypothetical protein
MQKACTSQIPCIYTGTVLSKDLMNSIGWMLPYLWFEIWRPKRECTLKNSANLRMRQQGIATPCICKTDPKVPKPFLRSWHDPHRHLRRSCPSSMPGVASGGRPSCGWERVVIDGCHHDAAAMYVSPLATFKSFTKKGHAVQLIPRMCENKRLQWKTAWFWWRDICLCSQQDTVEENNWSVQKIIQ